MAVHLLIGLKYTKPKNGSRLEQVPRCEPSTYQPINQYVTVLVVLIKQQEGSFTTHLTTKRRQFLGTQTHSLLLFLFSLITHHLQQHRHPMFVQLNAPAFRRARCTMSTAVFSFGHHNHMRKQTCCVPSARISRK